MLSLLRLGSYDVLRDVINPLVETEETRTSTIQTSKLRTFNSPDLYLAKIKTLYHLPLHYVPWRQAGNGTKALSEETGSGQETKTMKSDSDDSEHETEETGPIRRGDTNVMAREKTRAHPLS
ncbi:hypothetical protein J6590_066944 [Homalodisca vitripennis]|nr:hypothetical protein J6590_066944 [Homalodisca vitripennis]